MTALLHAAAKRVQIERAVSKRRRTGRMPKQVPPTLIRVEYAKYILRVMGRLREAFAPLLLELPSLLENSRGDSSSTTRSDSVSRTRAMIDQARERMRGGLSTHELEAVATRLGDRTVLHNTEQLNRQTRAAIGVDVIGAGIDAKMRGVIERFAVSNAELIKGLSDDITTRIGRDVMLAVQKGTRHSDLAKQIQKDFEIGENRAKLIARDQIGTLYSKVNTSRQKSLGIKRFIWRTVKDARVRDEHEEREGETYEYDNPPDGELPGEPINCRCFGDPVLDDLLGALDE